MWAREQRHHSLNIAGKHMAIGEKWGAWKLVDECQCDSSAGIRYIYAMKNLLILWENSFFNLRNHLHLWFWFISIANTYLCLYLQLTCILCCVWHARSHPLDKTLDITFRDLSLLLDYVYLLIMAFSYWIYNETHNSWRNKKTKFRFHAEEGMLMKRTLFVGPDIAGFRKIGR